MLALAVVGKLGEVVGEPRQILGAFRHLVQRLLPIMRSHPVVGIESILCNRLHVGACCGDGAAALVGRWRDDDDTQGHVLLLDFERGLGIALVSQRLKDFDLVLCHG